MRFHKIYENTYKQPETRNIAAYLFSTAVNTCGTLLCTNTFIQAYLVQSGFTNAQIGILGFVDSLTMMAGFFFLMGITARVKNIVRANAISTIFYAVIPTSLVAITLVQQKLSAVPLLVLCIVYTVQNLGLAFKQAICNKSMVNFISPSKTSRIISVSSIMGNLLGIFAGVVSPLILTLAFPRSYTLLFALAALLFFLGTLVSFRYKILFEDTKSPIQVAKNPFRAIVQLSSLRPCRNVLLCHLSRGIYTSAVYYIIVVALQNLKPGPMFSSYAFTVSTVATLLGALFFGFLSKRFRSGMFYVVGAIISCSALIPASLTNSENRFLLLYFCIMFGNMLVDISVPAGIYQNFESGVLGPITSARMLLSFAGKSIAMLVIGTLLGSVPTPILFLIIGIQQLAGALLYAFTFRAEQPR